jgi:anthranilate synthase/aminodeoxychorismate synthase-like glutamine amidotransferase
MKMCVLIIDNYDSFVYNLAHYVLELGFNCEVVRNDKISCSTIKQKNISHLIFSPGPCTPDTAGITLEAIKTFQNKIPMLGVCLGHQAIGQAFGSKVIRALEPMHGKESFIKHDQQGLFKDLDNPLLVGRYHSLILEEKSLANCLKITARDSIGQIMAIQHLSYPIYGLQFHPESVLSPLGKHLLAAFLQA